MAIALVQSNKNTSSTSPLTVTLTGVTVGNTIIVAHASGSGTATVGISDNVGNTYSYDKGPTQFSSGVGAAGTLFIASALVVTGGSVTVSVTTTASSGQIFMREYSGIQTSLPLRTSSSGNSTGSTTLSVSPALTVVNGDLVVAFGYNTSGTYTKNASYTNIDTQAFSVIRTGVQDWVGVTTTSTNASFGLSTSGSWDELAVAYQPSIVLPPTLTGIASLTGVTSITC